MLTIKKITATKANELLQDGGLNFILFAGDDFDAQVFAEWCDHVASAAECNAVRRAVADLAADEALQIEA